MGDINLVKSFHCVNSNALVAPHPFGCFKTAVAAAPAPAVDEDDDHDQKKYGKNKIT